MNIISPETVKARALFFKSIRDFFENDDYIEVDTPQLVVHPSLEPFLDPYVVPIEGKGQGTLITSPEFSLKKVFSRELPKIFEISHCFRSEEPGPWHSSEFTMLEWYTLNQNLDQLIEQCQTLLKTYFPEAPCHVFTLEDWFQKHLGHGLDPDDMRKTLIDRGLEGIEKMSASEIFFRLFLPTESQLESMGIVFLKGYPAEQSSYAKVEQGYAQRFEIYIHGVEVANAYLEETRPQILLKKLTEEQEERKQMGKDPFSIDLDFVQALSEFEQPICGIALGLDRLFALSQNQTSLEGTSPYKNFSREP